MQRYYWCLEHGEVEQGAGCRAAQRLGPYPSAEAARAWRDRVEEREDAWEAEDERWHGDEEPGDGAAPSGPAAG